MPYKIIFSDIDGTLLNKDRQISHLTRDVFRKLQRKVPVVLISSRMPQAMKYIQQELEISHQPIICYNGGQVLVGNESVNSKEIPLDILQNIHKFNAGDCHISLYHGEEWYVPSMDHWAKREQNNTKVTPMILSADQVLKKWKKQQKGAHKIMCMGSEKHIDRISDFLSREFLDNLHLYRSKPTYLEVSSKEVSKLTAIEYLLEQHFHYPLESCIAFGDNYNDYEMLKAVGWGVAVGNAKPEILEIAREVTHHGSEDGVAKTLQRLFKIA